MRAIRRIQGYQEDTRISGGYGIYGGHGDIRRIGGYTEDTWGMRMTRAG